MNVILAYPETWQTSFQNFTQIVSLRAYERTGKKICFFSNFFRWQFTLVRCYARTVVRLGLRNFPLK